MKFCFVIKMKFSILSKITEIKLIVIGSQIVFVPDDSIQKLFGFDSIVTQEKYSQAPKPVTILSFDKVCLENDIANGIYLKAKELA